MFIDIIVGGKDIEWKLMENLAPHMVSGKIIYLALGSQYYAIFPKNYTNQMFQNTDPKGQSMCFNRQKARKSGLVSGVFDGDIE